MSEGSGLEDSSVDFAMLFNILHVEEPTKLLRKLTGFSDTAEDLALFTGT
jgi:hypothetical protein